MLVSAVSVLVVAQSSSEIPEGLMNNPVLFDPFSQSDFKSSVYCVPSNSVTLQAAFHSIYHQAPRLTTCVCVSALYKLPRSYNFTCRHSRYGVGIAYYL